MSSLLGTRQYRPEHHRDRVHGEGNAPPSLLMLPVEVGFLQCPKESIPGDPHMGDYGGVRFICGAPCKIRCAPPLGCRCPRPHLILSSSRPKQRPVSRVPVSYESLVLWSLHGMPWPQAAARPTWWLRRECSNEWGKNVLVGR